MSDEKHEKIADIVKEMRTLGRLDEKSTDKIPRTLQALGLRTYADRIEAAAKHHFREATKMISDYKNILPSWQRGEDARDVERCLLCNVHLPQNAERLL